MVSTIRAQPFNFSHYFGMTSASKALKVETRPKVSNPKTGEIKLLEKEKWYLPVDESKESPTTAVLEDIESPTPLGRIFPYPEEDLTSRHLYVQRFEEKGIQVVDSNLVIYGLRTLRKYLEETSYPELEKDNDFAIKNEKLKGFFFKLLSAMIAQEVVYQKQRVRRHEKRKEKANLKAELMLYAQLQAARQRWDGRTHGRYPQCLKSRLC